MYGHLFQKLAFASLVDRCNMPAENDCKAKISKSRHNRRLILSRGFWRITANPKTIRRGNALNDGRAYGFIENIQG
jgi:hypothetical protein